MIKNVLIGCVIAAAMLVIPVLWAQMCVDIAVGAVRVGIVRPEFAGTFGVWIMLFPWVAVLASVGAWVVRREMRTHV